MTTAFAVLVLAGAALYFMSPAERLRLLGQARTLAQGGLRELTHASPSEVVFNEFLRERARWPIVTPVLLLANVGVFVAMVAGPGALSDPQTLIGWGANQLPRTTGGEWWRLASCAFVHAGPLHLLTTLAAMLPLGLILERAIGRIAFVAVYLTAAIVTSVVSLWTTPLTGVTLGASGAVAGIYGLAIATIVYGCMRQPRIPVPLIVLKRVAAGALVWVPYTLATSHFGTPGELAGLATGLVAGLVVAGPVVQRKPAAARAPLVAAVTVALAVALAVPLRGMIDARPELARIAGVEERTASGYSAAVEKFKKGQLSAKALALEIDRNIIPVLQADRGRVDALRGAPRDQAPLLVAARHYFELRLQSWRRRAEGLRTAKLPVLNDAERLEREALDALDTLSTSLTADHAS